MTFERLNVKNSLHFLHNLLPFKGLGSAFLELLLPRGCAGCRENWPVSAESCWCDVCREKLPWIRSPICPVCGRPFQKSPGSGDHLCGDCELSTYSFDSARSAAFHSGVARDGVHRLKFGGHLHWVPPLVELLETVLTDEMKQRIDLIVPVPLHVRRLRQRGFNQAALLARELGRRLEIPVHCAVLFRRIWTEPQTRLNREERLHNVKGAFAVLRPADIKGKKALLIDDVFTTGSTLCECAGALKEAEAAEVHALTVSRSLPDWRPDASLQDLDDSQ